MLLKDSTMPGFCSLGEVVYICDVFKMMFFFIADVSMKCYVNSMLSDMFEEHNAAFFLG